VKKKLLCAFEVKNYSDMLKWLQAQSSFTSLRRLLMPVNTNTSDDWLSLTGGRHWVGLEVFV
jgi:hypothetical protein